MFLKTKNQLVNDIRTFASNLEFLPFQIQVCEDGGSKVLTSIDVEIDDDQIQNIADVTDLVDAYILVKQAQYYGLEYQADELLEKLDVDALPASALDTAQELIAEHYGDVRGDLVLKMVREEVASF